MILGSMLSPTNTSPWVISSSLGPLKKKKSSIHQDKVAAYKQAPLQGAAGKTSVQREPTVATWDLWFQQDLKFPPKNPAKTVLCNHEAKNTFK